MVKNLPAVQETRVQYLGRENPLEKEMATHSSILAWRIPWTEEPVAGYSPWGCKGSDTSKQLTLGARHSYNRIVCKILKYQWNGNPALVPQFLLEFSLPWLLKSLSLAVPATQPARDKPLISLCPSQQSQIDPGSTRELTLLGVVLAPCRPMPRVHLAST